MQLIHYTLRNLTLVLLLVVTFWAGLFYFRIIDEVHDETDDSLKNYSHIIVKRAMADTTVIYGNTQDIMTKYIIAELSESKAKQYREHFTDSVMFIEEELEFEPVRVFKTAFKTDNGRYYELKVLTSILEKDDLQEAIFQWVVGLYIILIISILIVSKIVFKKSLQPLYKLLEWLNHFTLGSPNRPLNNPTKVKEFKILNKTITEMVRRNEDVFIQQKQFIENASHELQTPLAICLNKLEFLSESPELTELQLEELSEIHQTMSRAIKLNKSLLLLSRIENLQFRQEKDVEINPIVRNILSDLNDIYENKEINVSFEEKASLTIQANESLIVTLVTNLLKNAWIHNEKGGSVEVKITTNELLISNSCGRKALDPEKIFDRFYHTPNKEDSSGLGLAIVKSIVNLYGIKIDYYFDGQHHFRLLF